MHEPASDHNQPAPQHLDPQRRLLEWADGRDRWVHRLVSNVVASRRSPTDAQVSEIFDLFLAEHGLGGPLPADEPELVPTASTTADDGTFRLIRLSDVKGVNKLRAGEVIEFSPGLTILFGENGTGKTGYARVLKRMSAVRRPEAIIPDIGQATPPPASATVDYELGGEARVRPWANEAGVAPFTRMSVFDSPAVNLQLDGELTYVFTPAEISLFEYVSDGIRAVQDRGQKVAGDIAPGANAFLRYFEEGTEIYERIAGLGPATDLDALFALVDLPADPPTDKVALEREIAALQSNLGEQQLDGHRAAVSTWGGLASAATAVQLFDAAGYNERLAALDALQQSYRQLREAAFAPGDLPGPADDDWQRFVTEAEAYKNHLTAIGIQHDDRCIYCRQPLGPDAVALQVRYAAFVDDTLARQIAEQAAAVRTAAEAITSVPIEDHVAALQILRGAVADEDAVAEVEHLLEGLAAARTHVASGQRVDPPDVARLSQSVLDVVEIQVSSHEAAVAAPSKQLEDLPSVLREARSRLNHLTEMIELDRHLTDIKSFVERQRRSTMLEALRPISGVRTSLTNVAKAASEDLLNRDFKALFEDECAQLRAPNVRLDFVGRRGIAHRRKTLTPEHHVSEILCESEQRVLALADFLAEARMGGSDAPIVLDDPVTSLDHRRLRQVATRIAALADQRQVILFTHDIWLTTALLGLFEKRSTPCMFYGISGDEVSTGHIERATGPRWDNVKEIRKRVNAHIAVAERSSGESQKRLVEEVYGLMRSWCEVAVEEVIFGDVVRRFRPNIMMGRLVEVHPDRMQPAIDAVSDLFDRACAYIPDHSQPLPTLGVRPALTDAKADWQLVQQAVDHYRKS